jgi:hypothetical protein
VDYNEDTQDFKLTYTLQSGEHSISDELDKNDLPLLAERITQRVARNQQLIEHGKKPYPITAEHLFEDLKDLKEQVLAITHQRHHTFKEHEEKNKIPPALRDEIELLLRHLQRCCTQLECHGRSANLHWHP